MHVSRVFLERLLNCFELRRQTSPVFTRTRAYVRQLLVRWMRPLGSPRRADPACTARPVRASGGRFHSNFTLGSSIYTLVCSPYCKREPNFRRPRILLLNRGGLVV